VYVSGSGKKVHLLRALSSENNKILCFNYVLLKVHRISSRGYLSQKTNKLSARDPYNTVAAIIGGGMSTKLEINCRSLAVFLPIKLSDEAKPFRYFWVEQHGFNLPGTVILPHVEGDTSAPS
jgi:hypothetical protein